MLLTITPCCPHASRIINTKPRSLCVDSLINNSLSSSSPAFCSGNPPVIHHSSLNLFCGLVLILLCPPKFCVHMSRSLVNTDYMGSVEHQRHSSTGLLKHDLARLIAVLTKSTWVGLASPDDSVSERPPKCLQLMGWGVDLGSQASPRFFKSTGPDGDQKTGEAC